MSSSNSVETTATGTVTSSDGTRIAYDRVGEGPTVVIVDGAFCNRAFGPSAGLASMLADEFTVYYYDRRGRGESTDTQPFAVEREIEDLQAIIRETGGSTYAVGISSGAALGLIAAAQGSNITKLAIWEAPYTTSDEQVAVYEQYKRDLSTALASGDKGSAVDLFMTLVGNPPEMIAGMHQAPFWPAMEALAPTLAYDAEALGDQSVPEKIAASVEIPTLVMDGGASPLSMRQANGALADAIYGAQYKTLEGQTHEVAQDVLTAQLKEFFSR